MATQHAGRWFYAPCRLGRSGSSGYQTYTHSEDVTPQEQEELARVTNFMARIEGHEPMEARGWMRLLSGRYALFHSGQGLDDAGRSGYYAEAHLLSDMAHAAPSPVDVLADSENLFRGQLKTDELQRRTIPDLLTPDSEHGCQPVPLKAASQSFPLATYLKDHHQRVFQLLEVVFPPERRRDQDLPGVLVVGSFEDAAAVFAILWECAHPEEQARLSFCSMLSETNRTSFTVAGWLPCLARPSQTLLSRFRTAFAWSGSVTSERPEVRLRKDVAGRIEKLFKKHLKTSAKAVLDSVHIVEDLLAGWEFLKPPFNPDLDEAKKFFEDATPEMLKEAVEKRLGVIQRDCRRLLSNSITPVPSKDVLERLKDALGENAPDELTEYLYNLNWHNCFLDTTPWPQSWVFRFQDQKPKLDYLKLRGAASPDNVCALYLLQREADSKTYPLPDQSLVNILREAWTNIPNLAAATTQLFRHWPPLYGKNFLNALGKPDSTPQAEYFVIALVAATAEPGFRQDMARRLNSPWAAAVDARLESAGKDAGGFRNILANCLTGAPTPDRLNGGPALPIEDLEKWEWLFGKLPAGEITKLLLPPRTVCEALIIRTAQPLDSSDLEAIQQWLSTDPGHGRMVPEQRIDALKSVLTAHLPALPAQIEAEPAVSVADAYADSSPADHGTQKEGPTDQSSAGSQPVKAHGAEITPSSATAIIPKAKKSDTSEMTPQKVVVAPPKHSPAQLSPKDAPPAPQEPEAPENQSDPQDEEDKSNPEDPLDERGNDPPTPPVEGEKEFGPLMKWIVIGVPVLCGFCLLGGLIFRHLQLVDAYTVTSAITRSLSSPAVTNAPPPQPLDLQQKLLLPAPRVTDQIDSLISNGDYVAAIKEWHSVYGNNKNSRQAMDRAEDLRKEVGFDITKSKNGIGPDEKAWKGKDNQLKKYQERLQVNKTGSFDVATQNVVIKQWQNLKKEGGLTAEPNGRLTGVLQAYFDKQMAAEAEAKTAATPTPEPASVGASPLNGGAIPPSSSAPVKLSDPKNYEEVKAFIKALEAAENFDPWRTGDVGNGVSFKSDFQKALTKHGTELLRNTDVPFDDFLTTFDKLSGKLGSDSDSESVKDKIRLSLPGEISGRIMRFAAEGKIQSLINDCAKINDSLRDQIPQDEVKWAFNVCHASQSGDPRAWDNIKVTPKEIEALAERVASLVKLAASSPEFMLKLPPGGLLADGPFAIFAHAGKAASEGKWFDAFSRLKKFTPAMLDTDQLRPLREMREKVVSNLVADLGPFAWLLGDPPGNEPNQETKTIEQLQKYCGVKLEDGVLGPDTVRAILSNQGLNKLWNQSGHNKNAFKQLLNEAHSTVETVRRADSK